MTYLEVKISLDFNLIMLERNYLDLISKIESHKKN